MKRILIFCLASVGAFLALPALIVVAWTCWAHLVQSPRFAADYFEGVLEFEEVIGSRRWIRGKHLWGGRWFGCTYAIVKINRNAPLTPPDSWAHDWSGTPLNVPEESDDPLAECAYLWPDELNERLSRAGREQGSYYAFNSDTLLLYAPKEELAVRVQFGG